MPKSSSFSLRTWLVAFIVSLVGAQIVVGCVEAFQYHPSTANAYSSEVAMRSSGLGSFLAGFHYWASAALLLISLALLLEMLCNEGYRQRWQWFGALGSAIVAFVFQITGNLLPMDRHGVQTAVVEAGIAGKMPVVGHATRAAMIGGTSFSNATLSLWWLGHAYILVIAAVIAALLLAPRKSAGALAYLAAPVVVILVALIVHAPLGHAATDADFGQYNASVSWYTWPLHAMMGAFDHLSPNLGWVGSIGVPTVIMVALLTMPWLGPKLSPRILKGTTLGVGIAFLAVGALYGGPIATLTGNRDPVEVADAGATNSKSTNPAVIALVARGAKEFDADGCADCHGKGGAKGDSGPDLSNTYKAHSDPAWFNKLIRNPKSVTPSATMPAFPQLSEDQVNAISTFLSQPR